MIQVLTVISPLFLIILGSALAQRFTHMGENWGKSLNEFALKVGLPALIFMALIKVEFSLSEQLPLLLANSIFIIIGLAVAFITGKILRLKKQMFSTLLVCFMLGNFAYLGIPILSEVYGQQVLPSVSLIIAIYLFWVLTGVLGYLDYSNTPNKKKFFEKYFTI